MGGLCGQRSPHISFPLFSLPSPLSKKKNILLNLYRFRYFFLFFFFNLIFKIFLKYWFFEREEGRVKEREKHIHTFLTSTKQTQRNQPVPATESFFSGQISFFFSWMKMCFIISSIPKVCISWWPYDPHGRGEEQYMAYLGFSRVQ